MAMTKRKDILDNLVYQFGTIRKANGYQTDLVTAERRRDTAANPFDESELWAVNVFDGTAQVEHFISEDTHHLPVTLEIITTSAATVDELEECIADVCRCIDLHNDWGGHADGTNVESHGINESQAGDIIKTATVEITINYTTDRGKI